MSDGTKLDRLSTGNEFISIPGISTSTAGIECVSFMHKAYRACIELHGMRECPLLKPVVEIDGADLFAVDTKSERIAYWIPRFSAESGGLAASATVFAPLERRGFVCILEIENQSDREIRFRAGWKGCWESTYHVAGLSKPMSGTKSANIGSWQAGMPVVEFHGHAPQFAIAFASEEVVPVEIRGEEGGAAITEWTSEGIYMDAGSAVRYEMVDDCVLKPSETRVVPMYVGIGLEEVSASASAQEMRIQGWNRMLNGLTTWLENHTIHCADGFLKNLMNVNSFYNYFFCQATTLDTEEFVVTTSRSSRSDWCATYMDRDAMRWSLPAVLQIDWAQARKMLIYAFTTQLSNVGVRSRFMDGIVLEPGLQLGQLCAPVRALSIYVQLTDDMSVLFDRRVQTGVNTIQQILAAQRHPTQVLFETLLLPSGAPSRYPYVCYSNILVWRVLVDITRLYDRIRDVDRMEEASRLAERAKAAILENFVVQGPFGPMFAQSIDLEGNFEIGDDPGGSLQLLTYFEFCSAGDPVYRNTVAWIHSEHNPSSGREWSFAAPSVCGVSGPSIPSVVNDLLTERKEHALDFLRRARLDDGVACESVDCNTGSVMTGPAFASCAGYLAFGLRLALDAVLPKNAAVKQKRRPSETLYHPPPETSQDAKKARM